METQKFKKKDEYAYVLDVIKSASAFNDNKLVQAVGTANFNLLELVPRANIEIDSFEKVYIGDDSRDKISSIRRVLFADKLTKDSKDILIDVLIQIIKENEKDFVNFFNNALPLSIRSHSLELIPGIGKKHVTDILMEVRAKPFENFEDITQRCPFISKPEESLAKRIKDEIENKDDFKLFRNRH